jgi:hypothetical protein
MEMTVDVKTAEYAHAIRLADAHLDPSAGSRASLYGVKTEGAFVDALPIRYDHERWMCEFLSNWAPGYDSYFARIANGPAYYTESARPTR